MRRPEPNRRVRRRRARRVVGTFERLEPRCLLAPTLVPTVAGTVFRRPTAALNSLSTNGFVSIRLISTQTGRIEADPTGRFGDDVFVVSRTTGRSFSGLLAGTTYQSAQIGDVYRVDPYGANLLMGPAFNRRLFARISLPTPPVSSEGYVNWFDLAFDVAGGFGPTLFVSAANQPTTVGIDPANAIYAFQPNGTSLVPASGTNPAGAFAFSTLDANSNSQHDTRVGAIAVAPGDTFGMSLYALDHALDGPTDGNSLHRIWPGAPAPVNMDLAGFIVQPGVEAVLPPLPPPPPAVQDIDVRAMVFDPNRGLIIQGQYGEPAFQMYGGLYVASTDINDTGFSRILHFPSLGSPPVDVITPLPWGQLMIGDMAFDPIGHFGGGLFYTDYQTASVYQLIVSPVTGTAVPIQFATGFNISPVSATNPQLAYQEPFSITFSRDGQIMFVSDLDGIWAFYAGTMAHSASGTAIGLTDIRELRAPYTGKKFAAAVIDSGVDGAHLGFQGTVAPGYNTQFPAPGNFIVDPSVTGLEHGTNVAGIIHQIAPDAVIAPIDIMGVGFNTDNLYAANRFVRDNPFVDDPRTPLINEARNSPRVPGDERIPIVTVNMSLGVRTPDDPANNVDSERNAFDTDRSTVISLKFLFKDFRSAHRYGITPVGSAGNEGERWNGMSSSILPAALNEVVDVIAAYPYGPSPPLPGPPVTFADVGQIADRCALEGSDTIAFPGKIPGFSNRNRISDFAAPGTCVTTFSPSWFLTTFGLGNPAAQAPAMAPLRTEFNGTSAAAPMVSGSFVFAYDVIRRWAKVKRRGGTINPNITDPTIRELHFYLVRDLARDLTQLQNQRLLSTPLKLGSSVPNFRRYLKPDGINSLLQWTAIPREDVNIGESLVLPEGTDDNVIQPRLMNSHKYRTYAHVNIANFLSAVEGAVALSWFKKHPGQLKKLAKAAGVARLVSGMDIDVFVLKSKNNVARAMARLLGGTDRVARRNRMTFLDLVADERVNGGILVSQVGRLLNRLLPGPRSFVITNRHGSANKGFALDRTAKRNYHDLNFILRSHILAPQIDSKYRNMTPSQISLGLPRGGGSNPLSFLPVEGDPEPPPPDTAPFRVVGHAKFIPDPKPAAGRNTGNSSRNPNRPATYFGRYDNNLATINERGVEYVYEVDAKGRLFELARGRDGSWTVTNISARTKTRLHSHLTALDLTGPGSRVVFGLNKGGEVIVFRHSPRGWRAENLTARFGLPEIRSSLTVVLHRRGRRDTYHVFGLNSSGEIIEYRKSQSRWQAVNITRLAAGTPVQPGLVAYPNVVRGRKAVYRLYAFSKEGNLIQYVGNAAGWRVTQLPNSPSTGQVLAQTLVVTRPFDGSRRVFALDDKGNLLSWSVQRGRGWSARLVTFPGNGPHLVDELTVQRNVKRKRLHLFSRDRSGRVVELVMNIRDRWSWKRIPGAARGTKGDLAPSSKFRTLYSERIDGAIAEYLLSRRDRNWHVRTIRTSGRTPARAGVETSALISLLARRSGRSR